MKKSFRKYFVAIWIVSSIFFGLELLFGFAANWMIKSMNYVYMVSLIFLFLNSDFFTEKTTVTDKLIHLKGYDIWGLLLIIIGVTIILVFIGLKSSVIMIMAIATFVISIWILLKYKKLISKSLIIKSLIIGFLCGLSQYNYLVSFFIIFTLTPFFFISASLLNDKFRFIVIHLNNNSVTRMMRSFLLGCLFSLPMALSNLSDVMATNPYKWITQLWQPILAFNFVLLEETWVRLFIITFIFVLVSSKTDKKIIPITAAILISSVIFGFTHYPNVTVINCINISILYGLPLGVLLCKRDFESVVGYHFMINFISAVATFVISS